LPTAAEEVGDCFSDSGGTAGLSRDGLHFGSAPPRLTQRCRPTLVKPCSRTVTNGRGVPAKSHAAAIENWFGSDSLGGYWIFGMTEKGRKADGRNLQI